MDYIQHTIPPVYDQNSRVLILGTMPSPSSRKAGFCYSHPQNRFWKVLPLILEQKPPVRNEEKRAFLLRNRIAIWDVLHSCEIDGADDASIRNPVPNDLSAIFEAAEIRAVFTTGAKASALYLRHFEPNGAPPCHPLPSTSPANARFSLERLAQEYRAILPFLA